MTDTGDVLGDGYSRQTIPLGADRFGPVVATLVSHRDSAASNPNAVLAVHGFTDYFFQTHVAEHFVAAGYDFHALDLRAYGRSLRAGEPPNYIADLASYDEELNAAAELIGARNLVVVGHSTGGLIAALWAHRHPGAAAALVLNSPWLDLQANWLVRTLGTHAVDVLGARDPMRVLQRGLHTTYGESLHADHHGEWTYNLTWKPLGGFQVRAGWIRAIRRGHAVLHAGLDVAAPVLVLRSGRSILGQPFSAESRSTDTVLDTRQIARWAPWIGRDVTVQRWDGALHDVYLSTEPVRTAALESTTRWLASVLDHKAA